LDCSYEHFEKGKDGPRYSPGGELETEENPNNPGKKLRNSCEGWIFDI